MQLLGAGRRGSIASLRYLLRILAGSGGPLVSLLRPMIGRTIGRRGGGTAPEKDTSHQDERSEMSLAAAESSEHTRPHICRGAPFWKRNQLLK